MIEYTIVGPKALPTSEPQSPPLISVEISLEKRENGEVWVKVSKADRFYPSTILVLKPDGTCKAMCGAKKAFGLNLDSLGALIVAPG